MDGRKVYGRKNQLEKKTDAPLEMENDSGFVVGSPPRSQFFMPKGKMEQTQEVGQDDNHSKMAKDLRAKKKELKSVENCQPIDSDEELIFKFER